GLQTAVEQDPNLKESTGSSTIAASPPWRWALWGAAASLALLAIPAFLLVREMRYLNGELNRVNNQVEALQHRYQAEHATSLELQKQLAAAGQPGQSTAGPSDSGATLPAVASIFPLSIARSGDAGDSGPVNVVVITGPPHPVVFSLDADQNFASYRIALAQSNGQVLWKADQLKPTAPNTLAITVPSSFLHQGDYLLTLEGLTRHGTYAPAGRYSFRVKFK
ncbi:MAG TPA: hypothetical protein VJ723_07070, partial [Candidatus Angelobacter sp.]|nr:hypothetical protein [Candidatus Angelobacter sp.]